MKVMHIFGNNLCLCMSLSVIFGEDLIFGKDLMPLFLHFDPIQYSILRFSLV